jgi:7-carboxy-7-deazaguanine synthase
MTKLLLVENGIFPITKNADGTDYHTTNTGLTHSGTTQGEGKLLGTSCLFVRTSSCNLKCIFSTEAGTGSPCDTPFSTFTLERNLTSVEDIVNTLEANRGDMNHVVLSGGEPTVQSKALTVLCKALSELGWHITIETNATIFSESLCEYVNLWSMSPKLNNSVPSKDKFNGEQVEALKLLYKPIWEKQHKKLRRNIDVIQRIIDNCFDVEVKNGFNKYRRSDSKDFQLKFVVSEISDFDEIQKDYIDCLTGVDSNIDILIMPEGSTLETQTANLHKIMGECIKRGWRLTPRFHTLLFNTKRGV